MKFLRPAAAVALCLAWLSLGSQRAQADLVIAFSPDGLTSSANVLAGDSFDIDIYVRDTAVISSASSSPLVDSGFNYGLGRFNVLGTLSASLSLEPVNSTASFQFATPFAASGIYDPDTSFFTASWTGGDGVFGNANLQGAPLLLGTVHLKALAAGQYTLNIKDPNVSFTADFLFGPPGQPGQPGSDAALFGPTFTKTYTFDVNVSAVPEPGSMSLVALASGGLWLARRRFRRSK